MDLLPSRYLSRSDHRDDVRDATFPLRRAGRWRRSTRYYTTDLRYLALRPSRLRSVIAVYELAGIDHSEHQLWLLVGRAGSWVEAANLVGDHRVRVPTWSGPPPSSVLDLPESLVGGG